MVSQLLQYVWRKHLYTALSLVVSLQAAGWVGYLYFDQIWIAWTGLLGSVLAALGLGWLIKSRLTKPLEDLSAATQILATDCANFSSALGELARGNLAETVTVQSQALDLAPTAETSQLVKAFNSTVAGVQTAADEFNNATGEPLHRLCYVGADSYLEGRICGEAMGRALGGTGQVAVTLAFFRLAPLALRRKGFESILRERYPGVQVVDVVETTFDPEQGCACAYGLMERFPNLAGIYVTDGSNPTGIAQAVTANKLGGRIKIICHDLVGETPSYLRQGVITATLFQDLFTQGHDAVVHLFNHLVTGWRPSQPRLLTRLRLITCTNLEQYWQPGNTLIESTIATDHLAQPIIKAPCSLRIAVQNREVYGVDQPLHMGALAAAAKLRSYNARVELVSGGILTVEPVIDWVVNQGYNGMAILAANNSDVPLLNRAAKSGVTIATYNAEPLSLRGWVASLAEQADLIYRPSYLECGLDEPPTEFQQQAQDRGEVVRQAINFMYEHLETSITVAEVARFLALDPSYFCRLFTEQTGRNPRDFLIDIRIQRAKEYLAQSDISVMDVGSMLGYDPSYFSRLFKRRVGCSPGQYASERRPR